MPVKCHYFFSEFSKGLLQYIASAQQPFPEDHVRKLGVFMNHVGIFCKDDHRFTDDIIAVAACSQISDPGNGKDAHHVSFVLNRDELAKLRPDTLKRFEEKTNELHQQRRNVMDQKTFDKHIRLANEMAA